MDPQQHHHSQAETPPGLSAQSISSLAPGETQKKERRAVLSESQDRVDSHLGEGTCSLAGPRDRWARSMWLDAYHLLPHFILGTQPLDHHCQAWSRYGGELAE